MTASTVRYALPTDLTALEPLRELLGNLPAVFPTGDDRRIRPLAIGIDQHLVEIAIARGAEADQAAAVVRGLGQFPRSGGLVRQIALKAFLAGADVIQCRHVPCAATRSGCSVAG